MRILNRENDVLDGLAMEEWNGLDLVDAADLFAEDRRELLEEWNRLADFADGVIVDTYKSVEQKKLSITAALV